MLLITRSIGDTWTHHHIFLLIFIKRTNLAITYSPPWTAKPFHIVAQSQVMKEFAPREASSPI